MVDGVPSLRYMVVNIRRHPAKGPLPTMAALTQQPLFSWKEVDRSPEIERFKALLGALAQEKLLARLTRRRRGRRFAHSQEALWRALLAKELFGHHTLAELVRDLLRNPELRQACGFEKVEDVPTGDYVWSRFQERLGKHAALVEEMFDELVERLAALLPDLGRRLAVDSKALPVEGARPADADTGVKTYEDGATKKTMTWFGYKVHVIADAAYELPLGFEVTPASAADTNHLMPLVEKLAAEHPEVAERGESLAADRAYDSAWHKQTLHEQHHLSPLIPPRDLSANSSQTYKALDPQRHDTIYLGPQGEVVCKHDPFQPDEAKSLAPMQFMGYEAEREALKFRCPAAAYGIECKNRQACRCRPGVREGKWGRIVRVPLERDRRLLTPAYFHSRSFKEPYKARTSIERLFNRVDHVHHLERNHVRSIGRMRARVGMVFLVMLAQAAAAVAAGHPEALRRILRPAA